MDWKSVIEVVAVALGTAFVVTSIVVKANKKDSPYKNDKENADVRRDIYKCLVWLSLQRESM